MNTATDAPLSRLDHSHPPLCSTERGKGAHSCSDTQSKFTANSRSITPQMSLEVGEEPAVETIEKKPGEQFTAVLAPWESYIVTVQSLLIWEKPIKSLLALMAFDFLYWFCIYCQPKPLFVLSSMALLVFLHHQWVHIIWPEIRVPLKPGERPAHYTDEWLYLNPSVLSAPEVGLLLDQWCSSLQGWLDTGIQTRRHRPALVCVPLVLLATWPLD
ncbi:hypothetical protein FHG87_002426 [Trinorchestia longiramus]|nr:hypothetical protein FHG87_002426 [Trinorchestia longiramus]